MNLQEKIEALDAVKARFIQVERERDEARAECDRLKAELERLTQRVSEDNAVCLCGCPAEDHESVDEGECCGEDGHDCLRVAPAVAEAFRDLRAQLREARELLATVREFELGEPVCIPWVRIKNFLDRTSKGEAQEPEGGDRG